MIEYKGQRFADATVAVDGIIDPIRKGFTIDPSIRDVYLETMLLPQEATVEEVDRLLNSRPGEYGWIKPVLIITGRSINDIRESPLGGVYAGVESRESRRAEVRWSQHLNPLRREGDEESLKEYWRRIVQGPDKGSTTRSATVYIQLLGKNLRTPDHEMYYSRTVLDAADMAAEKILKGQFTGNLMVTSAPTSLNVRSIKQSAPRYDNLQRLLFERNRYAPEGSRRSLNSIKVDRVAFAYREGIPQDPKFQSAIHVLQAILGEDIVWLIHDYSEGVSPIHSELLNQFYGFNLERIGQVKGSDNPRMGRAILLTNNKSFESNFPPYESLAFLNSGLTMQSSRVFLKNATKVGDFERQAQKVESNSEAIELDRTTALIDVLRRAMLGAATNLLGISLVRTPERFGKSTFLRTLCTATLTDKLLPTNIFDFIGRGEEDFWIEGAIRTNPEQGIRFLLADEIDPTWSRVEAFMRARRVFNPDTFLVLFQPYRTPLTLPQDFRRDLPRFVVTPNLTDSSTYLSNVDKTNVRAAEGKISGYFNQELSRILDDELVRLYIAQTMRCAGAGVYYLGEDALPVTAEGFENPNNKLLADNTDISIILERVYAAGLLPDLLSRLI